MAKGICALPIVLAILGCANPQIDQPHQVAGSTATNASQIRHLVLDAQTATPQEIAVGVAFFRNMNNSGLTDFAGTADTMSERGKRCVLAKMIAMMSDDQINAVSQNTMTNHDVLAIGFSLVPRATDECRAAKVIP